MNADLQKHDIENRYKPRKRVHDGEVIKLDANENERLQKLTKHKQSDVIKEEEKKENVIKSQPEDIVIEEKKTKKDAIHKMSEDVLLKILKERIEEREKELEIASKEFKNIQLKRENLIQSIQSMRIAYQGELALSEHIKTIDLERIENTNE